MLLSQVLIRITLFQCNRCSLWHFLRCFFSFVKLKIRLSVTNRLDSKGVMFTGYSRNITPSPVKFQLYPPHFNSLVDFFFSHL